jgi:hypothetical protein
MGLCAAKYLPILNTASGTATTYLPRAQQTLSSEIHGYTDITPEAQGVDFGGTVHFKYNLNDIECLTKCTLCVKLDGLVAAGGGVNPRYPDDVLCHALDKITFMYGKELHVLSGDEIHFRRLQETNEDDLKGLAMIQGLGLTKPERILNATVPIWYYLDIPFWWTLSDDAAWHQYTLQRLTRITLTWRGADYILQQDTVDAKPTPISAGNYILDQFLRFDIVSLSNSVQKAFISQISGCGDRGWLYMLTDVERLCQQVVSGQTTHTILLNTFSKYGYNLRFVIREAANLEAHYTNNERFSCLDLNTVKLDISGKNYLVETDRDWLKQIVNTRLFSGNPELPIYNIPFTHHPEMHRDAMGGFDFSTMISPQIVIVTDALPSNCFVDFFLYCRNYIRLVIKGNETGASVVQPL